MDAGVIEQALHYVLIHPTAQPSTPWENNLASNCKLTTSHPRQIKRPFWDEKSGVAALLDDRNYALYGNSLQRRVGFCSYK
jgi:hypothetical protein